MFTPSLHHILHHLGLQEVMSEMPREGFHVYVPADYEGSERQSMDDVYRMRELVLLHRASGLRLEYLASESYYGDEVRYRFRSVFVITQCVCDNKVRRQVGCNGGGFSRSDNCNAERKFLL